MKKNTEHEREEQGVSLVAFDQYMREVRWRATVNREEEEACVRALAAGKAERGKACPDQGVLQAAWEARERLAVQYQSLVIGVARRFVPNHYGMELEDVIQEGNLGLLYALEYGEFRGVKQLRAYAKRCIRGDILKSFRDRWQRVHLPSGVRDDHALWLRVADELAVQLGREASLEEVAQTMGVSVERLVDVHEAVCCADGVGSLQAMLEADDADECRDFVSLYQHVYHEQQERLVQLEQVLEHAMETVLTQQEREVVRLRYGVGKEPCANHKQREIADRLGMSQQGVHKMEHRARGRLQEVLAPLVERSPQMLVG